MTGCGVYYKLARPDGWDFHTGGTINYRACIGQVVRCPNADPALGLCSPGVIHAGDEPNKCFVGAGIPCSAYLVMGKPVAADEYKHGFVDLKILEEIPQEHLDNLFGWLYSEACNPMNPFRLRRRKPTMEDIETLRQWASVRSFVRVSVRDSVRASAQASVWDPVQYSVWSSVGDSVWASIWSHVRTPFQDVQGPAWISLGASIRDSVWAYIGSLFPNVAEWLYRDHGPGEYPFAAASELWRRGLVPSYDGKTWRLHSGETAEVVWAE